MIEAVNPVKRSILAPLTTLEKISIPYWSVPKKNCHEGALNLGPLLIANGSPTKKGPNIAIKNIIDKHKNEGVFKNRETILIVLSIIFFLNSFIENWNILSTSRVDNKMQYISKKIHQ